MNTSGAQPSPDRTAFQMGQMHIDPQFTLEVREQQRALYPTQLEENDLFFRDRGEENAMRWRFFSPLHHAKGGLVTRDLIESLRAGGELLVVGAGPGDIERYLIEACGLNPACIHAGDIDLRDYPVDLGVKTTCFNMLEPWPVDGNRYQCILIPEALGMAAAWTPGERIVGREALPSAHIPFIGQVARAIMTHGPQSVDESERKTFVQLVCHEHSRLARSWPALENALRCLKAGGELRVNGHCMHMSELAALVALSDTCKPQVSTISFGQHSFSLRRAN